MRIRGHPRCAAAAHLADTCGRDDGDGLEERFSVCGECVVGLAMRLEVAEERELLGTEVAAKGLLACTHKRAGCCEAMNEWDWD